MQKLMALRVAVADHAPFMRRLLAESLLVRGFEVAGVAESAESAIELCRRAAPDALLFDLCSEQMDGVVLMHGLREEGLNVPVILLNGHFRADYYKAVDSLIEGALDFVERPPACDTVQVFLAELAARIRLASDLSESRKRALELSSERAIHTLPTGEAPVAARRAPSPSGQRALVIASSLGGCRALARLVPALPPRLGIGTVVVQQLPEGFTSALADRLDRYSTLEVREAAGGEKLNPGSVFLAPGGSHLRVAGDAKLLISTESAIGGLRPRADLTISDASRIFGESLLLVVLSGMGKDGLDGARAVKEAGGRVLVESEATAIAYGTPRAIVEAKLADDVLPLDELPAAITQEAGVWGGPERTGASYVPTRQADQSA
jgi:two-component system chemotaxis response regulator CheB